MQNKISSLGVLLFIFLLGSFTSNADEPDPKLSWPIEIESEGGFVTTLYQPQLESFEANILEGRMAVTIKPKDKKIIFGAVWFKARMATDLDNRTVLLEKMDIIKTHFPDMVDEEKISKFSKLLSAEIESWNLEMSLDRILASLNEVENLKQLSDEINNDPPAIYFRTTPAVMVMIDGNPILKKDEDSGLEYVVNTPFFIVKETEKETYYINGGPFWYTSKEILNGWEETKKPPSNVKKFAEKYAEGKETDSVAQSYTEAPELIVETKAAELVQVDGEIDYKPIDSTTLLYVSNTESDIIMDINSQNHYLLLAGRWYYSKSLKDGDWKFSEPDDLPAEFEKIPNDSEMASVRSGIPGTPEAQTALLEQSIPQTATIDRKTATVEVKYDGNPKFEKIEGTDVSYAVNTDKTVLLIKNIYYAIEDAVWFMSEKATGPWEVCVVRPDEVDQIPPASSVYNVKYTYIYESTPEVVYVGYLPGYTYSYVYGGVVVYGTGYYYRPWYGYYYYPRPVTWGYGVHYSPYGGWGFSVGISYGWIGWGFHPYRRAYWGPRGYHRGYRHGYNRGYQHGYNRGYSRGAKAGYVAGSRNSNRNVYNNRSNGVKQTGNVRNAQASNNMNIKARASGKSNNMYTDKKGNVYQRDQKGNFQNRSNRQQPSSTQQLKQSQNRSTTGTTQQRSRGSSGMSSQQKQNLNRSYQNRSTGTQNYNRSSSSGYGGGSRSGGSRPSGGSRGGSSRRR
ncbi:MAG: sulfur globule family protein [Bacteroidales bacterium]|nr:sulfur globule family protein [Bacteroidales bacterium]